jgi:hypothetical protein
MTMNWYRAGLPRMVLKGRLTYTTSKRKLSVQFSGVPNLTGREMLPCDITDTGPTPENGHDGASFDIEICSFLKAMRLMRLRAAPPSTRTWYNRMLAIVRETSNGSCPAPALFLGQSEASKLIDVSIHLWCGTTSGLCVAAATTWHRVFTTHRDMMSQEPPYMMWSVL